VNTATPDPRSAAADPDLLEPGWFYIPELHTFPRPAPIPVSMSSFVARFRAEHNGRTDCPRRLDFNVFGDAANYIHLLARNTDRNTWTFERFAPSYVARIGANLTGADIGDARFAPYNLLLESKLERLLKERAPFYVPTRIEELGGERVNHRLLIPMRNTESPTITHCLLMSV
jgi:hypothetical protein